MAPKRSDSLLLEEDLPAAAAAPSTSEEEEEVESEGEEEKVEEEPPVPVPVPAAEEGRAGDSDENDDVDDGNKSDSNDTTSKQTLTVGRSKRKKADLKPTEPYSSTGRKRPLEVEKKNKNKKKKKLDGEEGSGKKKSLLDNQRKFNDADEIVVLNGILGYKNKGTDPSDINHEELLVSIKESLHFDANIVELGNKMRRLKTKYNTIVKKYGEDPTFSKTHESERYNLMKLIWGEEVKNDNGNGNGVKSWNLKNLCMHHPCLKSNSLFNEGLGLLGASKVKEMDMKRRKLEMEELECHLIRLDIEHEQTMAVLAALKATKS